MGSVGQTTGREQLHVMGSVGHLRNDDDDGSNGVVSTVVGTRFSRLAVVDEMTRTTRLGATTSWIMLLFVSFSS